ncbi:MAG: inorganic polyphosphate/ATP-NAD kinase, partial [Candidatus Bathyarchaeota archaeon B63]
MAGTVGIVARTDREEAISVAARIANRFKREKFKVLLESSLAKLMKMDADSVPLEGMRADLIVTIGGDGTILRTCLRIPKPEPPILAVDMGVRGFLAEVPPEGAVDAVERYLRGDYTIERYSKIASFLGGKRLPDALNEVFVTSRHLAKLLHMRIRKNGDVVMECRADGVIVASQVGSTGYAFSAGG